ncbi:DUF3153 domain-containing protein [Saccharopolyspora rectivirgula]|jgi:hypothetical protein|uniref:LppM domain-containing protein n=1 Tax=Saccharopolyspora rectivirgula TaxID=28042 RepID=A0A073AYY0_9PSEU|nr:DUF3153 domain-containing protein [Saccharopolyspora rectivirgula]KEI44267.1 hypothetical protein GU90_11065 [Saccharopolyspora rectivirgula]
MNGNPSRARHRWRALLLAVSMVICALLAGCMHVDASLTISGDDSVSGEVLVSTQTPDGQVPFRLEPPESLEDRVRVRPYTKDGRAGSHLSFEDLSFDEVNQLANALSPTDNRFQFQLHRSGSLVTVEGEADLTPLANTDTSVVLEISAPGEITNTNGKESAGTVNWTLEPGEVSEVFATYQFTSRAGAGWLGWTLLFSAPVLAVTVLVGMLALRHHLQARAQQP